MQAVFGASVAPVQVSALKAKAGFQVYSFESVTVETCRFTVLVFVTVSTRGGLVVSRT